jgi:hypothetical protein
MQIRSFKGNQQKVTHVKAKTRWKIRVKILRDSLAKISGIGEHLRYARVFLRPAGQYVLRL